MITNYNTSAVRPIIDFFKKKGLGDFAICGILGNLYVESKLYPNNLQNSSEKALGLTDEEYTQKVDSGELVDEFCTKRRGYGVYQITSEGRSTGYYQYCKAHSYSVGDLKAQLEYMWIELTTSYKDVLAVLEANESIDACARKFMIRFEAPADKSEVNQKTRVGFAQDFYREYFGGKAVKIVTIDPGHVDKSNRSPIVKDYWESDFAWKWAMYIKMALEAWGIEVRLTRPNSATDRELVARGKSSKGSDAFISGHSNACNDSSIDRVVCIYMVDDKNSTVDEESKDLARILADVVKDEMPTSTAKIYSKSAGYDRNKNGIDDDEYYGVLFGAHEVNVPGVILEHSFHTNREAALWLMNDSNIKHMCDAEAAAIAEWLGITNKDTPIVPPDIPLIKTVNYVVKKGDSLGKIAKQFNTTVDDILALNPTIRNKNLIYVGQIVTVPDPMDRTYIVQKGDSLSKIGKKFGVKWRDIAAKNGIKFPWTIVPGQVLSIP